LICTGRALSIISGPIRSAISECPR
jgi:hypothetical protein